jgi:TonB family protein
MSAKPTKVPKQYTEYVNLYNDTIKFNSYIDSIIKENKFCSLDTNGAYQKFWSDSPATFKGGVSELFKFIYTTMRYPSISRELNVQGYVRVKFLINEDGGICNLDFSTRSGYGLTEEAIRIMKLMPNWNPATFKGKPAKSYYVLPITFKLQ